MIGILNSFYEAYGEKISLAKSKMLVSANVDQGDAQALSNHCGIALTNDFG